MTQACTFNYHESNELFVENLLMRLEAALATQKSLNYSHQNIPE